MYWFGFMGNLSFLPKTIDSGLPGPLAESLLINISLIALFGLQQIWFNLVKKPIPEISFKVPLLYRVVRHPIMLGVLIGIWAIPHMTIGHLVFALALTSYIVIGVKMEERDLTICMFCPCVFEVILNTSIF